MVYAFVDNRDLIKTTKNKCENIHYVMYHMQEAVNLWSGLIQGTGDAWIPPKTFWYVIDFTWQDEDWEYTMVEEVRGSLELTGLEGMVNDIESLEPYCVRRTFGVQQCSKGHNKVENISTGSGETMERGCVHQEAQSKDV